MGDIKNPNTQITRVNTDDSSKVFIGGGKSDAASLVGQEFADITGGTNIANDQLEDLLSALLTSKGWKDAPGLEGVELVSISATSFTIAISGGGPSLDYYEFSGAAAVGAIDAVSNGHADLKNSKSQVAIFDTDDANSIWIGGGKSDAARNVSQEFADITGGSRIHADEVDDLFAALTGGKGWDAGTHGLDGVRLVGITDEGFSMTIGAAGPTEDTFIFTGSTAEAALASADNGLVDIKDNKSSFAIFDAAEDDSIFIGGGKNTAESQVGQEFAEITGGTRIGEDEVLSLFEALTSGRSWNDASQHGLEGVELVGLDSDSFAIALKGSGTQTDYILFTNVDEIDGAADFGFHGAEYWVA